MSNDKLDMEADPRANLPLGLLIKDLLIHLVGTPSRAEELLKDCTQADKLRMGMLYECIRSRASAVGWYRTVHNHAVLPKHAIIGSMTCQNKLSIVDNLKHRGFSLANRCVLCEGAGEDVQQLFFCCPYSSEVWKVVCSRLCKLDIHSSLPQVLLWIRDRNRGKARVKVLRRVAFMSTLYMLWKERNARIFKGVRTATPILISRICYIVSTWMYHCTVGF
ncbi:uncharacterized protein LOC141601741 [Silene latifolia]|uniref:uncharacterized protein LOC141601741 n=1 Tax=Silene latifolia TaxID=37657 RepID=UPI003D7796C8